MGGQAGLTTRWIAASPAPYTDSSRMIAPGPGAWIIVPLPTYRPTCRSSSKKSTRSPGSAAASATSVPVPACSCAALGSSTPAVRQAPWVRLEQSNESGPVAPQTHGLPTWAAAKAMALAARTAWADSVVGRGVRGEVVKVPAVSYTHLTLPTNREV